ncbi:hypothetical protein EDEG_00141 [Edhazardia aedis USNM 41457]|uniref:Uncharacterized protein n=1 Tax=Edhazardia aedis (strain USNM 41457) TaxID=1003232 RepID=J9D998_EDHAE|nr:hypothetical protein EDEG_00141 [Edhazardia aedis USNM 41457]|eukprot:EJW04356.1 hypothetical protein EDEG_00141 [Edhazardia aedis USNM 41457]
MIEDQNFPHEINLPIFSRLKIFISYFLVYKCCDPFYHQTFALNEHIDEPLQPVYHQSVEQNYFQGVNLAYNQGNQPFYIQTTQENFVHDPNTTIYQNLYPTENPNCQPYSQQLVFFPAYQGVYSYPNSEQPLYAQNTVISPTGNNNSDMPLFQNSIHSPTQNNISHQQLPQNQGLSPYHQNFTYSYHLQNQTIPSYPQNFINLSYQQRTIKSPDQQNIHPCYNEIHPVTSQLPANVIKYQILRQSSPPSANQQPNADFQENCIMYSTQPVPINPQNVIFFETKQYPNQFSYLPQTNAENHPACHPSWIHPNFLPQTKPQHVASPRSISNFSKINSAVSSLKSDGVKNSLLIQNNKPDNRKNSPEIAEKEQEKPAEIKNKVNQTPNLQSDIQNLPKTGPPRSVLIISKNFKPYKSKNPTSKSEAENIQSDSKSEEKLNLIKIKNFSLEDNCSPTTKISCSEPQKILIDSMKNFENKSTVVEANESTVESLKTEQTVDFIDKKQSNFQENKGNSILPKEKTDSSTYIPSQSVNNTTQPLKKNKKSNRKKSAPSNISPLQKTTTKNT